LQQQQEEEKEEEEEKNYVGGSSKTMNFYFKLAVLSQTFLKINNLVLQRKKL